MIDITHKSNTLRTAIAEATVKVSLDETMQVIKDNEVPKGDLLESARVAALFGVKKTPELIPDCHPMPVEYTGVSFEMGEKEIKILVEVKTIYKTGVEVEAMHGASVAAMTMYDMLKPIDKGVEIHNIRLVKKRGGKSDYKDKFAKDLTAMVVVCSDTISAGQKEDKAGLAIKSKLESYGVEVKDYSIIPDEVDQISEIVKEQAGKVNMIFFTGGTGLSVRDVTPEAIEPLLNRRISGMEEAIRSYGQDRTPYSMLSRSIVGERDGTLVLGLPGSTNGAKESMDAIFPAALHVFGVLRGARHD